MLSRIQKAWRELDGDQRLAAFASLALLATMFLPWYQKNLAVEGDLASDNVSAFAVFSFVEAAVFLVAVGVFVLLFARGERRGFHLPGGDGTVIFAAGLWAAVLLLWRVFDRPDVEGRGATVGISWGFFFAFLAAAGVAAAGWKIRSAGRPEPPILDRDDDRPVTPPTRRAPPPRRRPADAPTEQLSLDDDPDPLQPGEIPRRER
jgi:hypothetical protein